MQEFISYSQHADDFIAWQLLGKKRKGLVLEVGAFDGIHLSNSYGLELLGWDSICVEPNPNIFKFLQDQRPKSQVFNCAAVGDQEIEEIDFYSEEIGVLSGIDYDEQDIKKRYANRGLAYKEPEHFKVAAKTLNQLLNSAKLRTNRLDVVSIDVEGFELEVLKGLDLSKWKVGLFIIEANDLDHKNLILNHFEPWTDYVHFGDNFQNLFIGNKNLITQKRVRNLDYSNYQKMQQAHPLGPDFTIDSRLSDFKINENLSGLKKRMGLF